MSDHVRRNVLSTPIVTVWCCDCGHVHVDLGSTTVRFDESSFAHVASALAHAARELDRRTPRPKADA